KPTDNRTNALRVECGDEEGRNGDELNRGANRPEANFCWPRYLLQAVRAKCRSENTERTQRRGSDTKGCPTISPRVQAYLPRMWPRSKFRWLLPFEIGSKNPLGATRNAPPNPESTGVMRPSGHV